MQSTRCGTLVSSDTVPHCGTLFFIRHCFSSGSIKRLNPPRPAEAAAGAAAACALSRPPALRPPARPPPPSTRPGVSFPLPPPPPPPPPSSSARPRGPPRLPARPYCSAPGLPPFPFPPAPLFPSVASRLQFLAFTPTSDQRLDHSKSSSSEHCSTWTPE